MKGMTRCKLHGGMTPLARLKAQETLAQSALPAAQVLARILADSERTTCRYCGFPKADPGPLIKTAVAVLDRTGFHPSLTLIAKPADDPWVRWLTDEQLAQVGRWIQEAKQRMAAGEPQPKQLLAAPIAPVANATGVIENAQDGAVGAVPRETPPTTVSSPACPAPAAPVDAEIVNEESIDADHHDW